MNLVINHRSLTINDRPLIIGIDGNEANVKNRVGVNEYAFGLLSALEKLPEAEKHKFIIYLKEQPLPNMPKTREGWRYEVLQGGSFWVIRKLMFHLWFSKRRPDVFFSPSHYAPLLLPIPMVVSIMDLGYLRFPEQFKKYDFYQLKYWGLWSMRVAKKILAISESTKRKILEHYPWASGKVYVTYPGYDRKNFQFPRQRRGSPEAALSSFQINKVKNKYGITGEYILFLSTLKPSKNVEGLLEAFRLLLAEREAQNLNLVIAGKKGWLFESIFKKVKELGLENFVIFTDFVSEEDKPALLAGAKVFVSPSFWEGFGIHVLEAMAVGTPVVASRVGSLPEVVGDAGILVDPKKPQDIAFGIKKAIKDYDKFSKAGIFQAEKFTWEKTASQTLDILESVLK